MRATALGDGDDLGHTLQRAVQLTQGQLCLSQAVHHFGDEARFTERAEGGKFLRAQLDRLGRAPGGQQHIQSQAKEIETTTCEACIALVALFFVQNSARTVTLSYDLGLMAWKLREPVPVVALLGGSFVGGLALGAIVAARVYGRRVKLLRDQLRYGDSAPEYR